MINCVIVDDEPLAREGLATYAKDIYFFNVVGECENVMQLLKLMEEERVDLVFLDIQMPKISGIDFLKTGQWAATKTSPMVILTTAFPNHAVEGYQLNVLDYLLKPVTFDRFLQAANKARDYQQLSAGPQAPASKTDYFFIKCDGQYKKIFFADILFAEGMQNYVTIYTKESKFMTLLLLKNLEENFDPNGFIRVHKSYIVAIDKIEGIEGNEISINGHKIPISRNYREELLDRVVLNKLLDK